MFILVYKDYDQYAGVEELEYYYEMGKQEAMSHSDKCKKSHFHSVFSLSILLYILLSDQKKANFPETADYYLRNIFSLPVNHR